jgi:hypothetical protein
VRRPHPVPVEAPRFRAALHVFTLSTALFEFAQKPSFLIWIETVIYPLYMFAVNGRARLADEESAEPYRCAQTDRMKAEMRYLLDATIQK